MLTIDAKGIYYKELNEEIRKHVAEGETEFILNNVNGQRYIGVGIRKKINITINGVPGNDLAAFMDGPTITINDCAQDALANTMNSGKIVVHGDAGDVLGYGMRGGELFIRDDVGYRVGIHMKEYKTKVPAIVVGGCAGNFFGEYMAGGNLIILGLNAGPGKPILGDYIGTGMHGGTIYIRETDIDPEDLGKEVAVFELDAADNKLLKKILSSYCKYFDLDLDEIMSKPFIKLLPVSSRPYGKLYCY